MPEVTWIDAMCDADYRTVHWRPFWIAMTLEDVIEDYAKEMTVRQDGQ